ncbi:MAG: LPS assembly protein LptD [Pararhodobacter sp.]
MQLRSMLGQVCAGALASRHRFGIPRKAPLPTLRRSVSALATAALLALAPPGPAQAQLAATLMADQVYVDGAGRLIASGSVEVWQGSVQLTASRVVFDRRQDQLIIEGPLAISDGPDMVFLADAAQLSPQLRAGIITSARVVLDQQMQIAAARVQRTEAGLSRLDAVVASSCPVCASNPTPLWEIRADRVIHDETTNQLHFQRAQFRMGGIPLAYLPRLRLPGPGLDRARGFLRPEFSADSDLGFGVALPYFMPLGDTRDLTLTPMVTTAGVVALGFRWRQAFADGGIEIGGQIANDDLTARDLRGYGYVRALFHLANDWRLTADVLIPSDRTFLETYDITDDARISGDVTLERVRRDQMIRARALGFHSLRAADNNNRLPNTALQAELDQRHGLGGTPIGGELRVQMGAQAFRRASHVDGTAGRDVSRAHLQLTWRRTEVLAGGILATGALDARADHVRVTDDSAYPNPVTRQAVQGMIEFRWPWAAVGANGARTVIEPIVQVIGARRNAVSLPNDDHTMPELDQGNLFALSRHSGEDAPDNGNRVNAGLRWSRFDASGWQTEALVGRIWRRGTLAGFNPAHNQPLGQDRSHWLLAGRIAHADGMSFDLRMLLDPNNDLSRAETNLSWASDRTALTTRYLFLPASPFEDRAITLSEWSVDLERRFRNGWSGSVGWEYDVEQSQFATARAGLAFRNECLAFDLSMRRQFVTATNPTASTRYDMRIELLGIGGRAPSGGGRTCGT